MVINNLMFSYMQMKQHIWVDLTFICKMVLLLLPVYSSVPVHNSLICWSTGTARAGWVGGPLAVRVQDQKTDVLPEAHGFDC